MNSSQRGMQGKGYGLTIEAAFQRESQKVYLDLKIVNESDEVYYV